MVGNLHLISHFQRLLDDDMLSHSFIFFGRPYIGKYTFAKAVAYALETDLSLQDAITYIESKSTPILWYDTHIVDEEAPGIDAARELKRFLSLRPLRGKKRVIIVNNSERFTQPAQHALLKISEEMPPLGRMFFIARNLDSLLPTIVSRSAAIYFRAPSRDDCIAYMRSRYACSEKEARDLYRYAPGLLGRMVQWKRDPFAFEKVLRAVECVEKGSLGDLYACVEALSDDRMLREDFFRIVFSEQFTVLDPRARRVLYESLRRFLYLEDFNVHARLQLEAVMNAYYAYREERTASV